MPLAIALLAAAAWLLVASLVTAALLPGEVAIGLSATAVIFAGLGMMAYEEGL